MVDRKDRWQYIDPTAWAVINDRPKYNRFPRTQTPHLPVDLPHRDVLESDAVTYSNNANGSDIFARGRDLNARFTLLGQRLKDEGGIGRMIEEIQRGWSREPTYAGKKLTGQEIQATLNTLRKLRMAGSRVDEMYYRKILGDLGLIARLIDILEDKFPQVPEKI